MGPSDLAQSAKDLISSDFVLSTILNQSAYQGDLPPFRINGVPVPITPKNIVLLMNTSTVEPIEKVSVQTIDTIQDTIVNSDKIFAPDAIECLKNFLLNKDNTTGYQSI
jgi:hypothetical protein